MNIVEKHQKVQGLVTPVTQGLYEFACQMFCNGDISGAKSRGYILLHDRHFSYDRMEAQFSKVLDFIESGNKPDRQFNEWYDKVSQIDYTHYAELYHNHPEIKDMVDELVTKYMAI